MPPKNKPNAVVMPFSQEFVATWELWKDYKWESHKFKYKGVISEQVAIQQLVDLSGGEEDKAKKIIFQSIRREWRGLFPLHETTTGNGKSEKKQSATSKPEQSITDKFKEAFKRNNGGGGQKGTGDHLKAV